MCVRRCPTNKRIRGVTGVVVDDLLGGDEDFGAWGVGVMRLKGRQLTQMAKKEIMVDVEHYKHELQHIEVSKSDKAKLERLL